MADTAQVNQNKNGEFKTRLTFMYKPSWFRNDRKSKYVMFKKNQNIKEYLSK